LQDFPLFSIFVWQSSLCIVVAGNVVENTCPRGSDSRLYYPLLTSSEIDFELCDFGRYVYFNVDEE